MAEVQHVVGSGNVIGEGPIWKSDEEALYWVNFIGQFQILRFRPQEQTLDVFETGTPVMALGLRKTGGFITATAQGIATWDARHKRFEPFCNPLAGRKGIRFNDAAMDSGGRFWVGTANDEHPRNPDGELFCVRSNRVCERMDKDITVGNGIGWSPDRRTMYFTDSFRYCIYAYDYDIQAGQISNRRIFVQANADSGIPDGLTVDGEGFVWSALWGGGRVVRYNPEGKLEREFRLPVPNATSCTFGGTHLDELYITTASLGLSDDQRRLHPRSGDLFVLKAGIKGLEEARFVE